MVRVLAFFAIMPMTALAQAGTDCADQVKMAVQSCQGRIQDARNSNVTNNYGGSSGVPDGGVALAGAAGAVSSAIGTQMDKCNSEDKKVCQDQCRAAYNAAIAKNDTETANKATSQLQSCNRQIDTEIKSGSASQATMARVAAQSTATANASGDPSYFNDQPIPSEQGTPNSDLQNVADNKNVPMTIQLPDGSLFQGTFGQYQVLKQMLSGTPLKVYPQGSP